MTTLTEQVDDGPVIVSLLKVRQLQTDQLGTPQAAAQQEGQNGMISFALRSASVGGVEKPAPLSAGEPVADPGTKLLRAFHPPDARCKVGTEQAIVGSLVGQSAHCRQPQVDGCRGEPSGLQLIAVPQNDRATERQSGFGAVPGDEVIDGEGVGAFRGDRAKALQN